MQRACSGVGPRPSIQSAFWVMYGMYTYTEAGFSFAASRQRQVQNTVHAVRTQQIIGSS